MNPQVAKGPLKLYILQQPISTAPIIIMRPPTTDIPIPNASHTRETCRSALMACKSRSRQRNWDFAIRTLTDEAQPRSCGEAVLYELSIMEGQS